MFFSTKAAVAAVVLTTAMSSFAMAGDGDSNKITTGYEKYAGCSGTMHTASGEWSGNGATTAENQQLIEEQSTASTFQFVEADSVPLTEANQ